MPLDLADFAQVTDLWSRLAARSAAGPRAEAEAQVFNQMAVALAARLSPHHPAARELALLAEGVARNGGYFPSDRNRPWSPDGSLTGYRSGQRIALTAASFARLAAACAA